MQETINPSRAAKQIGIPGSTLRLWAKTYAEFLSPGANPPAGAERRFTPADLEILKAVNQLRHNGMLPSDIAQRLRNNPSAGQQDVQGENIPPPPLQSIVALPVGTAATLADKLESVDRRLERVESQRSMILVAVAAFAAGVLVVAVVVWLLSIVR